MAAQDYHTISQPTLGVEASCFGLTLKKSEKKQQQELASLSTVLKTVEKELASAKSKATQAPEGPSNKSVEDTLAQLAGALQLLQVQIAKYADKKARSECLIAEAERKIAAENLKKASKCLKKIQSDAGRQKHIAFWEKFGAILAGALMTVVAAVTMDPALLIGAALCFAGATGLLSDATKVVAKGLEDIGMPPDLAKILGGIVVTGLVIVATAGVATLAGVETSAVAVANDTASDTEEGIEMAEMGAKATEKVSSEVSAKSDSFLAKAGKIFKKLNFFRKLSARTNLMIMAGAQGATQTHLITEIAGQIATAIAKADKKNAKRTQEEIEMITGVFVSVMTLLATAGAGGAMAESASAAVKSADEFAGVAKNASMARRFLSRFQEFGASSIGQKFFHALNLTLSLEELGTGASASGYQMAQGFLERDMASYKADTILDNLAIKMNDNEMSSSQHFLAQSEKQFKTSNRATVNLMKGEAAFAQLLCSSMV